jgi:hypothetical protein
VLLKTQLFIFQAGGDCDNLVLDAADKISSGIHFISESEKPAMELMQYFVDVQNPMMIAHVN